MIIVILQPQIDTWPNSHVLWKQLWKNPGDSSVSNNVQTSRFKSSSSLVLSICSRFFEYIYLYQSMVMFQIDQKTKDCSKVALTEAWDPFDIPDNSTFEDQYFIGGPGDNVEVQEWSDRKPARQRKSG